MEDCKPIYSNQTRMLELNSKWLATNKDDRTAIESANLVRILFSFKFRILNYFYTIEEFINY